MALRSHNVYGKVDITFRRQKGRLSVGQGNIDPNSKTPTIFEIKAYIDGFDQFLVFVQFEAVDIDTTNGRSFRSHFDVVNLPRSAIDSENAMLIMIHTFNPLIILLTVGPPFSTPSFISLLIRWIRNRRTIPLFCASRKKNCISRLMASKVSSRCWNSLSVPSDVGTVFSSVSCSVNSYKCMIESTYVKCTQ